MRRWLLVGLLGLGGEFLVLLWVGYHLGTLVEVALIPVVVIVGSLYGAGFPRHR